MSRCYACWVAVDDTSKIKYDDLKEETKDLIEEHTNDVTLYGGQSDSEYAEELIKKLWNAEGRYVDIMIQMTYLEDLPYEDYNFSEDEYADIMEIYPGEDDG